VHFFPTLLRAENSTPVKPVKAGVMNIALFISPHAPLMHTISLMHILTLQFPCNFGGVNASE
jgi:hypothetical protein